MPDTYLQQCLKDRRTMRWPDAIMPLPVYIAPFRWYEKSKQHEARYYQELVVACFQEWTVRSQRRVTFRFVQSLHDSQIDIKWRRVDRKSLGHCEYTWNKAGALYSAEIQIGISDGILHNQYNDPAEVKHTILHEIGHALGLVGHSDRAGDVMYVPHQYGVASLSDRDIETLNWLYKVPVGFDPFQTAANANLPMPYSVDQVLAYLAGEITTDAVPTSKFSAVLNDTAAEPAVDLAQQADLLAQRGQFLMATSMIEVIAPSILPQATGYRQSNPSQ